MTSHFKNKVALVTGAGSGVGRAVALALTEEGAAVALLGRRVEALEDTAREIAAAGGSSLSVVADVSDAAAVESAVAQTLAQFGRIDFLVNAAGVLALGPVTKMTTEDWDRMFDVNTKGCFLTARAAIPAMRAAGGGAIVNVASVFALASSKGAAAYAASKAAVLAMTQAMALDHIDEGIRINAVAPGSMDTPMLQTVARNAAPSNPDAVLQAAARLHPTRRLVGATEVARTIMFLLSDAAASIVGTTLVVDGGRSAKLGSAE